MAAIPVPHRGSRPPHGRYPALVGACGLSRHPARAPASYHSDVDQFEAYLAREGLRAVRSGGRTYPSLDALAASLAWIEARSLVVTSIDGVRVDGEFVARTLEHVADFGTLEGSREERSHESVQAARRVLAEWAGQVDVVDVHLEGGGTAVRDAVVTALIAAVLAFAFLYVLMSLLLSGWGDRV